MCVAVNCQMEFPLGMAPFFAVYFDFPLTFIEDFQPGGIYHQMRNFPPGGHLKLTLTDFSRLLTLL